MKKERQICLFTVSLLVCIAGVEVKGRRGTMVVSIQCSQGSVPYFAF